MANTASAKKRVRQSIVRSARNKMRRSRVNTAIRIFNEAIDSGNVDVAKEAFQKMLPEFERAGRMRVFHPGTVSRRISRLNARLKNLALKSA